MIAQYGKRALSFFLAMVMILSAVPVQAFATEEDLHADHDHEIVAEREQVIQLREMADAFVEKYELTPDMPDDILWDIYFAMDDDRAFEALIDMEDMVFLYEELTEDELTNLSKETNPKLVVRFYFVMQKGLNPGVSTYASTKSATPISYANKITVTSDSDFDYTDGVISASAEGSDGCMGVAASSGVVTLKVNNTYGKPVEVSFDVNVKHGSLSGVSQSNGKVTALIEGNQSITVTVTSAEAKSGSKAEIELSTFNAKAEVTFGAVEGVGSYTLSVNGEEQTITNTAVTRKDNVGTSYTLTAIENPEDEYSFKGWYDAADTLLGSESTYTFENDGEWAIYPVFSLPSIAMNFIPADEGGSYTIDDGALELGETGKPNGEGYALVATPDEGYYFQGWYNVTDAENPKYLDCNETYTLIPSTPMTVKPVFAKTEGAAQFGVGSENFYSLNKADQAAKNGSTKNIVLLNDGELAAGIYTISSGNLLVIPMDDAGTVYTTKPQPLNKEENPYVQPTAFRTLQMADGANIAVNGAISVVAKQRAGGTAWDEIMGAVHGPVGFIRMDEGSKITVNAGGNLYVWGYITGSGSVEVMRNGNVYEAFQVTDWRGGSAALEIVGNDYGIFPMNQYYVQNIEVPMKLNAGAIETGFTSTTITAVNVNNSAAHVPFVGNGGLFSINNGYLIKDYDETTDRQIYEIHGDVSMDKIVIEMQVNALKSVRVDSSEYKLPLTNNLTVDVVSGTINITQDLAFLPGSEIIIREGAFCNLANGKSVYVYDLSEWGGFSGSQDRTFCPLSFAPGRLPGVSRTALDDAKIQIDGTVNADAGFLYTTKSGAEVFSTDAGKVTMKWGKEEVTYQYTQAAGIKANSIPIQVAKLQNADGTTTDPSKMNRDLGVVYTYTDGVWVADCPGDGTCTFSDEQFACKAKECINCDYVEAGELAAHTPGAAATCTTDQVCTVCGDVLVEALNHKNGTKPTDAVPVYCYSAAAGSKAYYTCVDCGVHFEDNACTKPIADLTAWLAEGGNGYVAIPGHTWNEGNVTNNPTCTQPGERTVNCTVCAGAGITTTDIVPEPATGHTSVTVYPEVPATCTDNGVKAYYYCSACTTYYATSDSEDNKVLSEPIAELSAWKNGDGKIGALGHTVTEHAGTPAKCDAYGIQTYYSCDVCGKNYTTRVSEKELSGEIDNITVWLDTVDSGKIDKLPHTEATVSADPATCLVPGKTAGVECSVCKTPISGRQEIPVLKHEGIEVDSKPATCTAPGFKAYYQCKNGCNEYYAEAECLNKIENPETWKITEGQGLIPKVSHTLTKVDGKAPDCATDTAGTKEYYQCQAEGCGAAFEDAEGTKAIEDLDTWKIIRAEHTLGEEVRENLDEATGIYESVFYCTVCEKEASRTTIIPGGNNDHKLVMIDRVDPTCYSVGYTAGAYCEVGADNIENCPACKEQGEAFRQEPEEIAKLPHAVNPSSISSKWADDHSTCTASAPCINAGCTETVTETAIAEVETVAATCQAAGSATYTVTFTNEAFTKSGYNVQPVVETLSQLEHEWTVQYQWSEDYTSCTATATCSGGHTDEETASKVEKVTFSTSCTEDGYTVYTATFAKDWHENKVCKETVPGESAKGHIYMIVGKTVVWEVVDGTMTCTADLQCNACADGDIIKETQKNVAATVKAETKAATCDEPGEILYTATFAVPEGVHGVMSSIEEPVRTKTEAISALNHDWKYSYVWSTDFSSCTATRVCEHDKEHTATETVDSVSAGGATCTNGGTITYTADFADVLFETQVAEDYQEALKHDMTFVAAKSQTCKDAGNIAHYLCKRCHLTFADAAGNTALNENQVNIPADGVHKFTNYVYNNDATCDVDGTKTAACEYGCGTNSEAVPDPAHQKSGHNYNAGVILEGQEPTCTKPGTKTFTCQNTWCDVTGGHTYTETVDALGHELVMIEGQESTCDDAGYNAYYQCAAPKTRSGERTVFCGYYFATAEDTADTATPIATNESELTAWRKGAGALALRQCKDENRDHDCDYDDCNEVIGNHEDAGRDHLCDTYGESCAQGTIGDHEDKDNDQGHKCDYCGEKIADHSFTNGECTCGYIQDLKVNITIRAEGQTDQKLDEQTIKYLNAGDDFTKTLDLSKFGNCYEIKDMSATVGGAAVEYVAGASTLTIKSELLTGDIDIVVNAEQSHKVGSIKNTESPATCDNDGEKKTEITCKNCNTVYHVETEVIPAKGHQYEEKYTAPTFEADGFTTYTCKNGCGDSYTVTDEGTKLTAVAKIGSTMYATLEEAIAAANGRSSIELLTKVVVEGTQVWNLQNRDTLFITAVDGNYGLIIKGDLTIKGGNFVVDGMYGIGVQPEGKLTIDGGAFEVSGDNDYLIGSWGTTEINDGEFVGQYNCVNAFAGTVTINGGVFETAEKDCTGEWDSWDVLAEDAGTASITGGVFSKSVEEYVAEGYCQVEGKKGFEVAAHILGEATEENRNEADCVNAGSYQLVTKCTRCEAEISREDKVIPATGHTVEVIEGKAADCQNPGYKEAYYCSACEKYFATRVSEKELEDEIEVELTVWQTEGDGKIAPLPHRTYTISATPAGCEKAGNNKYYKCLGCMNAFEDEAGLKPTTDAEQVVPVLGHDHTQEGGKVVTPPNCTDKGYTTYNCSRCDNDPDGDYVGDYVDALGHDYNWDGGKIVTDPTCTAEGYTTYDCSRCDETHTGDEVSATGHKNVVEIPGQNAACGVAGWEKSYKCETCGVYFEDKACTLEIGEEAAWTEWKTNGDGKIDALVHNIVDKSGKEPECEIAGYKASYQCSRCNLYFSDKENQTLIGDGSEDAWKAWTAVGGEGYLKPKDHTDGDVIIKNNVAPKCEEDGGYDEVTKCADCGKDIKTNHVVVGRTGHTAEEDRKGYDPTCTANGLTDGKFCTACNKWTVPQEVIQSNGHKYNQVVEIKQPSCTEDGREVWKCATCDDTTIVVPESLKAKGHNMDGIIEAVAPTCTKTGLSEGKKCTACNTTQVAPEIVPATGHLNVTVIEQVDPDCENNGVKEYYHCNGCNVDYATKVSDTEYADAITNLNYWKANGGKINALGHENETIPAVPPTCTEDGWKAGVKCSVCGDILTPQEVDPAKDHNEVIDKAVPPTCTGTGLTEGKHCSRCDWKIEQQIIQATGHLNIITTTKVDSDCTNDGVKEYYYCEDCGKYYASKISDTELAEEITDLTAWKSTSGKIDKLGHQEEDIPAVAPSCTETGLTAGKKCTVCGETTVKQDTVPVLGHNEVIDSKVDPTCTETGLTEGKHCSRCDWKIEQEIVNPKGHKGFVIKGQAAKCELDGYKDYYQCGNGCKLFFEDLECTKPIENVDTWKIGEGKLPMIGHAWDTGRVTTLPTCTEDGVRTLTCGNCNGTKTAAEPMLGHECEQHVGQHPTYHSAGWEAYETCTRCDYSTFKTIEPLGEPNVGTFEEFMTSLEMLEEYANAYAKANPGKDPLWLLIKYVRTGVDRYNSGSWNIMAGYEDEGFAEYVMKQEEAYNKAVPTVDDMINVTGIKNIKNFKIPNGQGVDFGHMFGTMDITYHNKNSINHADVSGWAGDLVDLLSTADRHDVTGTVDEMIKEIGTTYLNHHIEGEDDQFGQTDMYGDLDGYYFMNELIGTDYEPGMLHSMMSEYFVSGLTNEDRADYFLKNRLGGVTGRNEIREAVFAEYTGNSVIATLEGTRDFKQADVSDMRKACCYAFADYLCKLAGDYVEMNENRHLSVFSSETAVLAPGITQQISKATTTDGKQVVYYTATADVNSSYVHVFANYKDNNPAGGWGMQRVLDQANAAQAKYGDPASEHYIPNYNVIASVNGSGYNMTTGEPSGVLMMNGVEYHAPAGGFFGVLKDGSPVMGNDEDYYALKEQGLLSEAIDMFGAVLVKDGKINISGNDFGRASRTAIGYTKTGKIVVMVMDGRQEPVSCGGSMAEIAQVMLDAGCVYAVNMDGGGSTTYVARQPGEEELKCVSKPSDGFQRSVSTSWLIVSTAPSSTAFDHAVLDSDVRHLTIGSTVQVTAAGVSATGNSVELPEGTTWAVSDTAVASIDENGIVTALANGKVDVQLKLGDQVIGTRTLNVVVPDAVYFTKQNMSAVYGEPATLPVAALFENKPVAITEADVTFSLSNNAAGTTEGFVFTGIEASNVKTVKVTAHAVHNPDATSGSININMFKPGEASFDFENADGGDRLLGWKRVISNSTTVDEVTYTSVDKDKPMVTEYTFGMDMTQIPMPELLEDLVYMLPGADVEGNNSAWDFLLQLAERVSVLTEVKATMKFDPDLEVDISKMSVNCEYFNLEKTTLDPETNELVMSLRWKDQTKAIDPETANPIVILAGIKLTPKADAAWDAKDRLDVVHNGDISYDIYLRANALYSFACKPENQETYKLYPFVNPDVIIGGAAESGGHFMDTYKEFHDEYTLNNGEKNGWVYEDGGYAYYDDGERYIGVQKVGDFYYDFGTDGINVGQTKFTGMFKIDGINHYAKEGVLSGGWYIDKDDKYYFDETGKAVDGEIVLDDVKMIFDNGLLIGGQTGFVKKTNGNTYYYQNGSMYYGWLKLGDVWYHFNTETGVMTVGDGTAGSKLFPDQEAKAKGAYYVFNAEGHALYGFPNNFGYYYWAGQPMRDQWVRNGYDLDGWYHTNGNGHFVTTPNAAEQFQLTLGDKTYTAVKIAYDGVVYTFDNNSGKLLLGSMVLKDGKWFYYWAGEPVNDGWFDFNGKTYYAFEDGHLATGAHTIDGKSYMFDTQGALIKDGTTLSVTMSADFGKMTIKTSPIWGVTRAKMAVWSEASNQKDMQWFDASQDGSGAWTVVVPMCLYEKTGTYQIHVYEIDKDGAPARLLVNTTYEVAKAGHVAGEAVKQNVVAATCTAEGGYDLVTRCTVCEELLETKHVTEPAKGHIDADKNDDCDICGEFVGERIETIAMHRLYNPNSGEHFYTGSVEERDMLAAAGWQYEGVAWNAPVSKGAPIFRLFNPNSGDHHYTGSAEERDMLVELGWQYEGVAWNTLGHTSYPQYRLYNPNADIGSHHYTGSVEERDYLVSLGWKYEGIGWYSC